jgi:hypothetical protein
MVEQMHQMVLDAIKLVVVQLNYVSLSCDEVTSMDN